MRAAAGARVGPHLDHAACPAGKLRWAGSSCSRGHSTSGGVRDMESDLELSRRKGSPN